MTLATHPVAGSVDPLILVRWSPRDFDGSAMSDADLETLFDAARWAPSAYNHQPWRFLYAHRDSPAWQTFLGLLLPFNAQWAQHASVLIIMLSDRLILPPKATDPVPSSSHSFDAGAAWALLALQATSLGYHTRAMTGFDAERARHALNVPPRFQVEVAIALGRHATVDETVQISPPPQNRARRGIAQTTSSGVFPAAWQTET